jgi:hypothetical protein
MKSEVLGSSKYSRLAILLLDSLSVLTAKSLILREKEDHSGLNGTLDSENIDV